MFPGFVIPLFAKSDIFGCLVLPCASSGVVSGRLADCQGKPTEIWTYRCPPSSALVLLATVISQGGRRPLQNSEWPGAAERPLKEIGNPAGIVLSSTAPQASHPLTAIAQANSRAAPRTRQQLAAIHGEFIFDTDCTLIIVRPKCRVKKTLRCLAPKRVLVVRRTQTGAASSLGVHPSPC